MAEPTSERTRPAASSSLPWVGVLLLIACAAVSLSADFIGTSMERRTLVYAEAKAYFQDHPSLGPEVVIESLLLPGELARAHSDDGPGRRETGGPTVSESLEKQRQLELQELLDRAVSEIAPPPAARYGWLPGDGISPGRLLYPLLHTNVWHLLGNGILLILLAVYLEARLGRIGFGATALCAALAGGLAFGWGLQGHERNALIGTTPMLMGLWLTFALSHWQRRGEGFYGVMLVGGAAWLLLPPWAGLHWSLGELFPSGDPVPPSRVYWSLIGGAAVGASSFAALWWRGDDSPATSSEPTSNPVIRRALKAREGGRPREALEDLNDLLSVEPESYEAAVLVKDLTAELGREVEHTEALLRVIGIELRRGLAKAAIQHWHDLTATGIPLEAPPKLLISIALALRDHGQAPAATAALRCALERSEDRDSRALAARIARAARGLDAEIVEVAAWRALGSIELGLNERRALENLIAEVLPLRGDAGSELAPDESESAPSLESTNELSAPLNLELSRERTLTPAVAVPIQLGDAGIEIRTEAGKKRLLRWDRIEAVALAAVDGLGPKHVMLIDLVLNWNAGLEEPLRVIRMRGDLYDPKQLVGSAGSTVDALRELMETILERSQALPLPDEDSALGRPFASFRDLETYQRSVLCAVSDGAKEKG